MNSPKLQCRVNNVYFRAVTETINILRLFNFRFKFAKFSSVWQKNLNYLCESDFKILKHKN